MASIPWDSNSNCTFCPAFTEASCSGVALKAKAPISIFIPLTNTDRLVARLVYRGPLQAPVKEGTPIGVLTVWIGENMSQETPLYAAETVELGSLRQRALDAVGELMVGWLR